MSLKNKLYNTWIIIKYVFIDICLITPIDKYYKDLLHVNRKSNYYFHRFLNQYNYISFTGLLLALINLLVYASSKDLFGTGIGLFLVWLLYVSRIKGLAYLAKFFNDIKDNGAEFKKPKGG